MNNYKYLIKKNNLKVNKITYKGNSIILYTPLGLFMIKANENIKVYDYLMSRGFDYLLPIVDYDNSNILFRYEEGIDYNTNEKALDFIRILSLLHSKTSYYKNIKKEDNKKIYDSINKRIDELKKYYDDLISEIENKEYYSPNEYLLIRNISVIYKIIFGAKEKLKNWYKKYKDNTRKRVCTLYNNYDLNNLLKTKDNIYIYDFEKSYIDSPIYDLSNFYNKKYYKFDFKDLYRSYSKVLELNDYEKDLLLILNIIPSKIVIFNDLKNIKDIKKKICKYYVDLDLLNSKEKESRSTKQTKYNK